MINKHKSNGEAICFICNKSEVDDRDILLRDYLDIIKRKLNVSKKPKNSKIPQKNILNPKDLNQICKCEKFAHNKCIIQFMLSFIETKCVDCGEVFNIDIAKMITQNGTLTNHYNNKTTYLVIYIFLLIIFIAGAICCYSLGIISNKFDFWNYCLGTILIFFAILIGVAIKDFLYAKKTTEKSDSFLNKFLDRSTSDLIEEKFNINLYLRSTIAKEKELDELYKKNNNEDNKEVQLPEDLEEKFHNHQIIKSSLVVGNNMISNKIVEIASQEKKKNKKALLPKSKTRAVISTKQQEEMILKENQDVNARKKSLRDRSPMITIKEAKKFLEDFSPINKKDSEKDLIRKFKVTKSNQEKKEDNKDNNSMNNIGVEKQNDALLVNIEKKYVTPSTDSKKV